MVYHLVSFCLQLPKKSLFEPSAKLVGKGGVKVNTSLFIELVLMEWQDVILSVPLLTKFIHSISYAREGFKVSFKTKLCPIHSSLWLAQHGLYYLSICSPGQGSEHPSTSCVLFYFALFLWLWYPLSCDLYDLCLIETHAGEVISWCLDEERT